METRIRFGTFVREMGVRQRKVSFNTLTAQSPEAVEKLQLRATEAIDLLKPYVAPRFMEQVRAVVPLALYLVLFQVLLLRQGIARSWAITAGLLAVMVGLMLFMEGLKLGIMPVGQAMGNALPARGSLPAVLIVCLLLGIGVTLAEPAIGALREAGNIIGPQHAPVLSTLLTSKANLLRGAVGLGVGLAAVLGVLRLVFNWSLKPIIFATVVATLGLTVFATGDPAMRQVIGLAWDCGAVTTGPVAVPLVLALGIGVAAALGKSGSRLQGFGIVTLASLLPIACVFLVSLLVTPSVEAAPAIQAWYEKSPALEIKNALQAIVPLVLFLMAVMKFVVKKAIPDSGMVWYGVVMAVVGLSVFNLGLTYGLANLGVQSGSLVPASFVKLDAVPASPLYFYALGVALSAAFAWFLGFGATLVEPALNALGTTVENLTNGAFRKRTLMYAISAGVATGLAVGALRIIFGWSLPALLIPTYLLLLVVTYFSSEEFVNVAWDSAGVTTGPVTVPLVLAVGVGLGNAMNAAEGFGILALASVFPILSVLTLGLYLKWRNTRAETAAATEDSWPKRKSRS